MLASRRRIHRGLFMLARSLPLEAIALFGPA